MEDVVISPGSRNAPLTGTFFTISKCKYSEILFSASFFSIESRYITQLILIKAKLCRGRLYKIQKDTFQFAQQKLRNILLLEMQKLKMKKIQLIKLIN